MLALQWVREIREKDRRWWTWSHINLINMAAISADHLTIILCVYIDILWIDEKVTLIVSLLHCSHVDFKRLYEIWDIPWICGEVTILYVNCVCIISAVYKLFPGRADLWSCLSVVCIPRPTDFIQAVLLHALDLWMLQLGGGKAREHFSLNLVKT